MELIKELLNFDYAELIGTIGSVIVLISMCFNVEKPIGNLILRVLNWVGCFVYIYYGILISSISVLMLNAILLVVDSYYLVKLLVNWKKNNKKK